MTTFQVWKYKNGIWQILDWGETWDKELPKKILRSASDGQAYAIRRDGQWAYYASNKKLIGNEFVGTVFPKINSNQIKAYLRED